jgi:hypothetical protein
MSGIGAQEILVLIVAIGFVFLFFVAAIVTAGKILRWLRR